VVQHLHLLDDAVELLDVVPGVGETLDELLVAGGEAVGARAQLLELALGGGPRSATSTGSSRSPASIRSPS
jgi:hypothetical protein